MEAFGFTFVKDLMQHCVGAEAQELEVHILEEDDTHRFSCTWYPRIHDGSSIPSLLARYFYI